MVAKPPRDVRNGEASYLAVRGAGKAVHDARLTEAIRQSGSAKEIARVTGVSIETAKRYRAGKSIPNALGLTRLMRWSRTFAAAVLWLVDMREESLDREEARLTQELHRLRAQRGRLPDALVPPDETTAPALDESDATAAPEIRAATRRRVGGRA